MKVYTRTGDDGTTALFGGGRVPKNHARVRAYGEVDELNAVVGWAVAVVESEAIREALHLIQHDLFTLGAELATPDSGSKPRPSTPDLPLHRIGAMEEWMDEATEQLDPLRNFILPGGSAGAAALHVARTVCRRAEREVLTLQDDGGVDLGVVRYLNRLSDLLFVFARLENAYSEVPDVVWRSDARESS